MIDAKLAPVYDVPRLEGLLDGVGPMAVLCAGWLEGGGRSGHGKASPLRPWQKGAGCA
jgi:hypothetical protein